MNANPLTAMGDSIKHPARRFADGGKVETAEELLKRLSGKYGVGGGSPSPTPAPLQPAPQAVSAPEKPAAPTIVSAANALKNRKQQIDQAVDGYACGGKIKAHANGGKISGPGTPTSDSIPAQVSETGEPIAVSTNERILSKDQDAFMEKLAQDLGFHDLDAMLEAGTGKPVGPTIKAGIKAAVDGMQPEQNPLVQMIQQPSPVSLSASPSTSNAPYKLGSSSDPHAVNPLTTRPQAEAPYQEAARNAPAQIQTTVDSLFPSVKRYANGGTFDPNDDSVGTKVGTAIRNFASNGVDMVSKANDVLGAPQRFITSQAKDFGNALVGNKPEPVTGAQERTFSSTTSPVQSANPLLNDNYRPMTSPRQTSFTEIGTKESQGNPLTSINMNANNEALAKANAIRQSMIDGDGSGPKVAMLGNSALTDTQNLMDKWSREDGTASAINQAIANPKAADAIASLTSSQMANDTNRQANADTNALTQQGRQLAADVTKRGQDIDAQEAAARLAGNPLTNALTQTQTAAIQSGLDDKKAVSAMLAEIQDPKTTPERRQALMQAYRLAQGKDPASKFIVVPGGEYTDPENPMVKMKEPSRIFNTETQQVVGAPQAAAAVPPADKRVLGQTYQTPKGPMIWRGTGWEAA